ncbi:uncharacterized protein LOC121681786 isoform X3 [Alosa sapidissima]|uniref:uncharacterized protein LOC121681786 isoform X3 n=1 Tax=Alosa sapidissima TaxID=34773 RepID=UPI001C09D048|nr:uncharacterized protein LOC121681786 isoform X3 [Alosa sapidissima]
MYPFSSSNVGRSCSLQETKKTRQRKFMQGSTNEPKRKAKQNNITPKRGSPDPLEEQAVSQDVGMSPVPSSSSLTSDAGSKKHPTKAAETLPDDEDDSPFISSIRSPQKVIECYDQVLRTFRKVRTMTEAFHRHNIDRGTIVATDCRTSCG